MNGKLFLFFCEECRRSYMWPVQHSVRGRCHYCGELKDPRHLIVRDQMPAYEGLIMTWEVEEL